MDRCYCGLQYAFDTSLAESTSVREQSLYFVADSFAMNCRYVRTIAVELRHLFKIFFLSYLAHADSFTKKTKVTLKLTR